jgi:hypothetical protein
VFWVISVYFNIRNTLPKFFTFLPGHPVYNRSRPARGSTPGRDKSLLPSLKTPDRLCGAHSLLFTGYGAVSPGTKRAGREADHTRLFSAEVSSGDISLHPQRTFITCTGATFSCVRFILSVSTTALSLGIERPWQTAVNNARKFPADARCQCDKAPCELQCSAPVRSYTLAFRPTAQPVYSCVLFDLTANSDVSSRQYRFTAARN